MITHTVILDYLFAHHILVSDGNTAEEKDYSDALFLLYDRYGILIDKGQELVNRSVYFDAASHFNGGCSYTAFYKGFPKSVIELSSEELITDQLYSYYKTYVKGDFSQATHSVFEQEIQRVALNCDIVPSHFTVIHADDVMNVATQFADGLCASTRPLNSEQLRFLDTLILEYDYRPQNIASKNTAINLILFYRHNSVWTYFTKFIEITDVLKVVEAYQRNTPGKGYNLKKLHFDSSDCKFFGNMIDILFEKNPDSNTVIACYERKKLWNGFLHHIHYVGKTDRTKNWVNSIRNHEKRSAMSKVEYFISTGDIQIAADVLNDAHGIGAVIRNLNYFLSRCQSLEQIEYLVNMISKTNNPILLMQLLLSYSDEKISNKRVFTFTHNGITKHHMETDDEFDRRKSEISLLIRNAVKFTLSHALDEIYGKLNVGRVYVGEDVEKVALPIYSNTGESGYGILTPGSRIKLNGNIIRAFTYWEKVNDVDLSVIGLDKDFKRSGEFSWRTMGWDGHQGTAITYSGDVTSGYNGGSEFFDINIDLFKQKYPNNRYLIFSNNVYSGVPFKNFVCRAGYMIRDDAESGEIYEPKTVKTSYNITAESISARLFMIDLETRELVWLNLTDMDAIIAGESSCDHLKKYSEVGNIYNYKYLFSRIGKLTEKAEDAFIVITDEPIEIKDNQILIHSYDTEKVIQYLTNNS